ncbi:MAG: hypothetical protein VKO44_01820 [Cyanobacteriota bacterium]|nr:hypothetical protein [Cyanobacteriota bacterium]
MWSPRFRPWSGQRLGLLAVALLCSLPVLAQEVNAVNPAAAGPSTSLSQPPAVTPQEALPPINRASLGNGPLGRSNGDRSGAAVSLAHAWRELVALAMFAAVLIWNWRLQQRLNRISAAAPKIAASPSDRRGDPSDSSPRLSLNTLAQDVDSRLISLNGPPNPDPPYQRHGGPELQTLENHVRAVEVQLNEFKRRFAALDALVRANPSLSQPLPGAAASPSREQAAPAPAAPAAVAAVAAQSAPAAQSDSVAPAAPVAVAAQSAPAAQAAAVAAPADLAASLAAQFQEAFQRNDRLALRAMADQEMNITARSEDALARRVGTVVTQLQVVDGGGSFLLIARDGSHWLVPSFQTLASYQTSQPAKGLFTYEREPAIATVELRRAAKVRESGGVWEVEAMGVVAVPA